MSRSLTWQPGTPSESHLGYQIENIERNDVMSAMYLSFIFKIFPSRRDGVRLFLFEGQDKLQFRGP